MWRDRRPIWAALMATTIPIMLIGSGLMLYNYLRFDSPFEFGIRYELGGQRQTTMQFFSPSYLWFNFRIYFLEPARWSARFPFVHEIVAPPLPAGHTWVEAPFGVLANVPLVWLALAMPLAWRESDGRGALHPALLFCREWPYSLGACALVICLYCSGNWRYEIEFLPALMLLAVIGILGLERALAPTSESVAG